VARVSINGVELAYDLTGPAGAPVVAFSNSLGSAIDMWDAIVPTLAGRYRCLRYDTRGHGRSGTSGAAVTIDDLAGDLLGLMDAIGVERAHIVGLSLGGMTGQALASRHPERVASLTLIATAAHLPPVDFWETRARTVRAEGPGAVVDTIVPRWFTPAFREHSPEAVAKVRKSFMLIDREGYARCCEAIGAMDMRERLAQINAPTLVMVGANDPVTTPAMAEALRAGIPNAELVVIPSCAHLASVERPDIVAAYLTAFIGRQADIIGNEDAFQKGLAVRKSVLGADYVEAALAKAGKFGADWQEFISRYAWGEVWDDTTLPRKTRSLLTLAMMVALHREEEFKLHLRPALGNGVSLEEVLALIKQAAVYAGVPAANAAMRWSREVLGKEVE
jgi:3-oxoadipate enol-lactonase/4-carboxymuconolactone decarboxylase